MISLILFLILFVLNNKWVGTLCSSSESNLDLCDGYHVLLSAINTIFLVWMCVKIDTCGWYPLTNKCFVLATNLFIF